MSQKPVSSKNFSSVVALSLLSSACTTLPVSGPHSDDIRYGAIEYYSSKENASQLKDSNFTADNTVQPKNTVRPVDRTSKAKETITTAPAQDKYAMVIVDGYILAKVMQQDYRAASSNWLLQEGQGAEPVRINVGDTISLTIYEAQSGGVFIPIEAGIRPGNFVQIPAQIIDDTGYVSVPYAGRVDVVGKTPVEVSDIITKRLSNIAIKPQVVVSFVNRDGSEVSVLGQVRNSIRYSLNFNGERVLDAIARASGPSIPGYEAELTLQRDNQKYTIQLSELVEKTENNIYLKSNDILYVENNPETFTLLGATGFQGEYNFNRRNITLSEAISRGQGLIDTRSDPSEVYIYRREKKSFLMSELKMKTSTTSTESIDTSEEMSVIYKFDLRDPYGYFLSQKFPIVNNDVIYIGNAETVELLKLLNIVNPSSVTTINTRQVGN